MKISVFNCSPKGQECSITARTIHFLDKMFPEDQFGFFETCRPHLPDEAAEAGKNSDIIIITSSIFGGSIHPQAMCMFNEFIEKIPKTVKVTYFITCNWLGEDFARRQVRQFFEKHGYDFIESYAVGDTAIFADDNTTDKMRWEGTPESIYNWFATVKAIASGEKGAVSSEKKCNTVIFDVFEEETPLSVKTVDSIAAECRSRGIEPKTVRLRDYNVKPCNACQMCYSDGICIYNDDMSKVLDEVMYGTDMIIMTGKLENSILGIQFENYESRFACFGRCSADTELIKTCFYVMDDDTDPYEAYIFEEKHFAFDSYAHDIHIRGCRVDRKGEIDTAAISKTLNVMVHCFNNNFIPSASMFERYFNKNFAALHIRLRNLCPTEYEAFKARGYYEEIQVEPHVKYIDKEEVKKSGINPNKPRTIPFQMMYAGFDKSQIKFTERRPYKNQHIYDKQFIHKKAAEELSGKNTKKSGFSLFGKKK